jgi:glycerol-3-phosphate dehydrogenase
MDFDRSQFRLVRDALRERTILMSIAPHLSRWLPILTPLYKRMEKPYYVTGLKLYDWLAGKALVHKSHFISAAEALRHCPILKAEGLRGGVVYYDGQFDDARMNLAIVMRAEELGARIANYVEVTGFSKSHGKISGVSMKDRLTGATWKTSARVVVNATGPFVDSTRKMDDPDATPLLQTSSGTHIVLSHRFSLPEMGLLIPKTEDKRVLFLLPWQNHTLVGTTDNPAEVQLNPKASAEDIAYILRQLQHCFGLTIGRESILSAWCGLRPLVVESGIHKTATLSRDHVILTSPSGLVTITGGKWTTYRLMALETVDTAIKIGELQPVGPSRTDRLKLAGGETYTDEGYKDLAHEFHIPLEQARHLHRTYGDRAAGVAEWIKKGAATPLVAHHPYCAAEVIYAVKEESARSSVDILARRMRLAFLDRKATLHALPAVHQLLAELLEWDASQREADQAHSETYFS